jgi:amicyanin
MRYGVHLLSLKDLSGPGKLLLPSAMISGAIDMRIYLKSVHLVMLLGIMIISITAAGCTGYPQIPGSTTTPQTPVPGGTTVTIQNFAFSPPTMTISQGTTVTWMNQDTAPHQVVNDASGSNAEGAIFKSPVIPQGGSYSFTFNIPGTYPYHCSIHPTMKGTITVR